jgi:hypothetical protein
LCIKQAGKEGTQNVGESAKNTNNNIKEDCNNREVAKILINSIVLILSTLFTVSEIYMFIYLILEIFAKK